jgi:hypothetical protein
MRAGAQITERGFVSRFAWLFSPSPDRHRLRTRSLRLPPVVVGGGQGIDFGIDRCRERALWRVVNRSQPGEANRSTRAGRRSPSGDSGIDVSDSLCPHLIDIACGCDRCAAPCFDFAPRRSGCWGRPKVRCWSRSMRAGVQITERKFGYRFE